MNTENGWPAYDSQMRIHLGAAGEQLAFRDLVNAMPDTEFKRLSRSTVALLAWWKDPARLAMLAEQLRWSLTPQSSARFESPERAGCSTCSGEGKSSFTDVMLDLVGDVVAIEAKRTERLYETVLAWLTRAPSQNRHAVLSHWLTCCLDVDGPVERYHGLVYQMVHRAASARRAAGARRAHVVHLLFGEDHAADYVAASTQAAKLLAPQGQPSFHVVVVPTSEGPAFQRMPTSFEGAASVREALLSDDSLFEFGPPSVRTA